MNAGSSTYKAGASVITEGESGKEMFVIESGSVEVFRGSGPKEHRISLLEAGDFFGEMVLLDDQPRSASARAATDCQLLVIDATTLDELLRQYPEVAVRMLRLLAGRLRAEGARADLAEVQAAASAPAKPAAKAATKTPAAKAGASPRSLVPPGGAPIPLPDKDDVGLGRFDSVSGLAPDIELGPFDTKKLTSRRHARLVRENGETFVLEEIGTANGTFVNGTRIVTGVKTRVVDGDTLRFGGVDLVYKGD
ncbi:MAG: cyclic nucleotide-binding domain-containing protein [Acidobacteriota bacterium]|nr:cyclic nucleotide-binding domain-containing protein [Acidobacteriota bacterium]